MGKYFEKNSSRGTRALCFVLFCDNIEGRKAEVFKESVEALGGIAWYGVANATDI